MNFEREHDKLMNDIYERLKQIQSLEKEYTQRSRGFWGFFWTVFHPGSYRNLRERGRLIAINEGKLKESSALLAAWKGASFWEQVLGQTPPTPFNR